MAKTWLREPLLHFVVLGAALFGVDHLLITHEDDPHVIVMGRAVDEEARGTFKASRGHGPDATELAALRKVWLDNEVLYREGLAMQVDRGDSAIRERVIFKALSVADANTKLPHYDAALLESWFEAHRDRYDDPARYDFVEAIPDVPATPTAVQAFVDRLNGGLPGDAQAGLRVFKARPAASLAQAYGTDFGQALDAAPLGRWQALKTRGSWRAMRADARTPAHRADFASLRGVVLQDWTDATLAEQRSAIVATWERKYKIVAEGSK